MRAGSGRNGDPCAATQAKIGLRRAIVGATRAFQMRVRMAAMNDQIPDIRNPCEKISEDENGIPLMQAVAEQEKGA